MPKPDHPIFAGVSGRAILQSALKKYHAEAQKQRDRSVEAIVRKSFTFGIGESFVKVNLATAIVVAQCFSACAFAQTPPAASASLRAPADAPPVKDNPAGPYAVSIESDPGLPTHTIYRPANLSPFVSGKKLPIVSWGNGACSNAGTLFKVFLTQIASHGYLAISIGPKDAPLPAFASGAAPPSGTPSAPPAAPAGPPAIPAAMSQDSQLIDAIDWAIKENDRKDSPYYKHLDTKKIAVMGQSCGGLQAIAVSSDPRIKTTVIWNSGVFNPGPNAPAMRLSGATKESLAKFHAPVAYFIGGPSDIAYANAEDDFKRIDKVPAFKANLNVGHGGTYRHPGGGWFGEVGVAWLDWQLKGDKEAGKYFSGADCSLCRNPIWTVEKKSMK
jgi:dienelactone hydrolase